MSESTLSPPLSPSRERLMLGLLALAQFAVILDVMVMMPLAPQLMSAFGIGPSAFSAAVSAYAWCACASGLLAAAYADRFDRKRLLVAMFILFFLGNVACALASNFAALIVARAFSGFSGGVVGGIVMAMVGDAIPASRRGAAISVALTASSLASILGVPLAVGMAARFGWTSPFALLAALSAIICAASCAAIPPMNSHVGPKASPKETLVQLIALFRESRHREAFALSMANTTATMLLVPFIAPILVGNMGLSPADVGWVYFSGGCSALITSRFVGRWCDRQGAAQAFCKLSLLFIAPALFLTHLPPIPLVALACFFPLLISSMSGRSISLQAVLASAPAKETRGAFLSANLALQQLAGGCAAWIGSLTLHMEPSGRISGYEANGWISAALCVWAAWWAGRLRSAPSSQHSALSMEKAKP